MPQGSHKYKAFISYSHQDKKWGDWLHKSLETYSIPKALIGKKTLYGEVPKRLFPVFRDRDELPTATELGTVIDKALNDSSHLVVICSPRSAKSQWVNEEIKQFKRLGKADRILCLIVDGEPYGADKPEMGLEECFPEAVKYELGEDGELSEERTEPIAADAREGKDGKRNALLKLVAGLLGVGFDELKQRDAVRRQRRMMMVAGVSGVLALVMGALAIWAWDQRNEAVASRQAETQQRKVAETQRQEAVKQKGIAEEKRKEAETELQKATVVSEFVGGIFTAVKPGELENVSDEDKDLMKLVLGKGAEKIKELEGQPEVEASIRTILGGAYGNLGFYDEALLHHKRALALRLEIFGPGHFDVASSYLVVGEYYYHKGEYDKSLEYLQKALTVNPNEEHAHVVISESYKNLGLLYLKRGEYDKVMEYFRKEGAIKSKHLNPDSVSMAKYYNNIALVYRNKGEYDEAMKYYMKSREIFLKREGPDNLILSQVHFNIGYILKKMGEHDKALEYMQKALATKLKLQGSDHPHVGKNYLGIGQLHHEDAQAQNKAVPDVALEYYQKFLDIYLKVEANHPLVANCYNSLGAAYNGRGEHDKALEYHQKALAIELPRWGANHGNMAHLYYNIGTVYDNKSEHDKALAQYEKTLAISLRQQGDRKHMYYVISSYKSIAGAYKAKNDLIKSKEYREKANTYAKSHGLLGTANLSDGETLRRWRINAEKGKMEAQLSLALCYLKGEGVQKDGKEAAKWFRKAAEQGSFSAQSNLAAQYAIGRFIEKDFVEAYKWVILAGINGYGNAQLRKDALAKKMTPEQIAKAKALAQEMIKKNPKLIRKK